MFYIAISKSISLFEISMAAINIRHKLATVLVILRRRRKRRQKAKAKTKRKFWITSLNVERFLLGTYHSTFLLARENDRFIFFKYIHMSPDWFDHLLRLIQPKTEKEYKVRPQISAERSDLLQHFGIQLVAIQSSQSVINIKWKNLL